MADSNSTVEQYRSLKRKMIEKKDLMRNNRTALRACILFNCLLGTSIRDAYNQFCRAVGSDVMEYREYEFWFYQFKRGDADFSDAISWNPNTIKLDELPIEVINTISSFSMPMERLTLRKVSKNLRTLIDSEPFCFQRIIVRIGHRTSYLQLDGYPGIEYIHCGADCNVLYGKRDKYVKNKNHVEYALTEAIQLMRNSNNHSKEFHVRAERSNDQELSMVLRKFFDSVEIELYAKKIVVSGFSFADTSSVLCHFKAGFLEEIQVLPGSGGPWTNVLVEMEQYKKAKVLKICTEFPVLLDIEDLLHFRRFEIAIKSDFTERMARKIRDVLTNSEHFEYAHIITQDLHHRTVIKFFNRNAENVFWNYGSMNYNNKKRLFHIEYNHRQFVIKKLNM
eukprot:NP_502641.1 F-box A protein [Caenorhabditis elegans]